MTDQPDELMTTTNQLPKLARKARGSLTQKEAAERLGVDQSYISKAENLAERKYRSLQLRMMEELAGWEIEPMWRVRFSPSADNK